MKQTEKTVLLLRLRQLPVRLAELLPCTADSILFVLIRIGKEAARPKGFPLMLGTFDRLDLICLHLVSDLRRRLEVDEADISFVFIGFCRRLVRCDAARPAIGETGFRVEPECASLRLLHASRVADGVCARFPIHILEDFSLQRVRDAHEADAVLVLDGRKRECAIHSRDVRADLCRTVRCEDASAARVPHPAGNVDLSAVCLHRVEQELTCRRVVVDSHLIFPRFCRRIVDGTALAHKVAFIAAHRRIVQRLRMLLPRAVHRLYFCSMRRVENRRIGVVAALHKPIEVHFMGVDVDHLPRVDARLLIRRRCGEVDAETVLHPEAVVVIAREFLPNLVAMLLHVSVQRLLDSVRRFFVNHVADDGIAAHIDDACGIILHHGSFCGSDFDISAADFRRAFHMDAAMLVFDAHVAVARRHTPLQVDERLDAGHPFVGRTDVDDAGFSCRRSRMNVLDTFDSADLFAASHFPGNILPVIVDLAARLTDDGVAREQMQGRMVADGDLRRALRSERAARIHFQLIRFDLHMTARHSEVGRLDRRHGKIVIDDDRLVSGRLTVRILDVFLGSKPLRFHRVQKVGERRLIGVVFCSAGLVIPQTFQQILILTPETVLHFCRPELEVFFAHAAAFADRDLDAAVIERVVALFLHRAADFHFRAVVASRHSLAVNRDTVCILFLRRHLACLGRGKRHVVRTRIEGIAPRRLVDSFLRLVRCKVQIADG